MKFLLITIMLVGDLWIYGANGLPELHQEYDGSRYKYWQPVHYQT